MQRVFTITNSLQQVKHCKFTPVQDTCANPSPPAEPLKNAHCPIARESLCSLGKAFPKASADQAAASTSEGSVPERKSPKPIRRCHRPYCHLVCSDLVGTPSETAWGPRKVFKLMKHNKLCWLRPTEVSFWKPGSQKKPRFPVKHCQIESDSSIQRSPLC